jgi:hypothetical protein
MDGMAAVSLTRAQVLAFRATGHGLGTRRPAGDLVAAFAAVGLRRTKTLGVAVAARVDGVTDADVGRALADETLVAVYGARGTVMVVPSVDLAVFTLGAAPDEASLRAAVPGAFLRRLDEAGVPATDALDAVVAAVTDVLASGPLPRGEVAMAVTAALPPTLVPQCRGRCPDPHVEDSLFRLAGTRGAMRFAGGSDVLTAIGGDLVGPATARDNLVRRYLRCHGPSTAPSLAAWMGISVADARRSLAALGDDAVGATIDGTDAGVLLRADVDRALPAEVHGVRFLPPFDAYLLDRDRETLVPDRAGQRIVWRASGNPGVVLVDAEPVATWRTKAGALAIEPLPGAPPVDFVALEKEPAP